MNRTQYYSRLVPILGIVYVIINVLTGWNTTVVVVGALILGIVAIVGNWVTEDGSTA